MKSQITDKLSCLFSSLLKQTAKRYIKYPHQWSLVKGISQKAINSTKMFPCHDVIMTYDIYIWLSSYHKTVIASDVILAGPNGIRHANWYFFLNLPDAVQDAMLHILPSLLYPITSLVWNNTIVVLNEVKQCKGYWNYEIIQRNRSIEYN